MAKVLVIDDSIISRNILKSYLTGFGHKIIDEAVDEEQGELFYKIYRPDFVTISLSLPKNMAIETIKNIRNFDPYAKILVLSHENNKELINKALEAGAAHYIIKPICSETITIALEKIL